MKTVYIAITDCAEGVAIENNGAARRTYAEAAAIGLQRVETREIADEDYVHVPETPEPEAAA